MRRLPIQVIKSVSLGREVYRGSIKASDLYPALWIDRYDEDENPDGYQRRFNEKRSGDAATYAEEEPHGFWPECILNIRAVEDDDGARRATVPHSFVPIEPGSIFGVLTVDYDDTQVKRIGEDEIPWMRAFSEVDCQHRLGKMSESDKKVTVCIFAGLTAVEEALIFRIINTTQRSMDTSLVDTIIARIGRGPLYVPTVHWAKKLAQDVYSPFYRKVDMGGSNVMGRTFFVKERTLRDCTELMIGRQLIGTAVTSLDRGEIERQKNFDTAYEFIRNYWSAVKESWPECWEESDRRWKAYKLLTTPGLKGLSMVGNAVFEECRRRNDFSCTIIKNYLEPAVGWVEWERNGDFATATGNAGRIMVSRKLRQKIVPETGL